METKTYGPYAGTMACGQCGERFAEQNMLYDHKRERGHLHAQSKTKKKKSEITPTAPCTCYPSGLCQYHEGDAG